MAKWKMVSRYQRSHTTCFLMNTTTHEYVFRKNIKNHDFLRILCYFCCRRDFLRRNLRRLKMSQKCNGIVIHKWKVASRYQRSPKPCLLINKTTHTRELRALFSIKLKKIRLITKILINYRIEKK